MYVHCYIFSCITCMQYMLLPQNLAAPDLVSFLPFCCFQPHQLSTTAHTTYPFDPAFSLLFWEPWNGARQVPQQALLDTWGSKSVFCFHQASYNISYPSRAFHNNAGNFTFDGHMDRLGSKEERWRLAAPLCYSKNTIQEESLVILV